MDKTKTRDITIRILAILTGIILWMYVMAEQNPEISTEVTNIPVKIVNADALAQSGLVMIEDPNGYFINLSVKGRSKDILGLKAGDFKAEANLANGYKLKGMNSVLVELKDWPRGIQIPNQPIYISVEFDELVQKNFPISMDLDGKVKEGYASFPPTIKPAEVILKGAAKYVGRVNSVVARVKIDNAESDIKTSMPIEILDKSGNAVSDIESIPKTVDVTIPVRRAKVVPINIKTKGGLPKGIYLKGLSVVPDKVTITGDSEIIDNTKSIETLPVSLDGITASTAKSIKLNLPQGIELIESLQAVNVNISVEGTINKGFDVPVTIANLPEGLNAELLANTITVTLSGQESVVNKVEASSIGAVVDLGNAVEGEGEYTPKVTAPSGVTIKDVQKIRIKITKKQG